MNKVQQRQVSRLKRARDFIGARQADFAAGSRAKPLFGELESILQDLESQSGSNGQSRRGSSGINKKQLLNELRDELVRIERTARAIEGHNPDFAGKFQLPDKRRKELLADAARTFLQDAAANKEEFLAYELPADFLDTLNEKLEAYESSQGADVKSNRTQRAQVSNELLERGVKVVGSLDVLVGNRYRNEPDVLQAWQDLNRTAAAGRGGRRPGTGRTAGRRAGTGTSGRRGRPPGSKNKAKVA